MNTLDNQIPDPSEVNPRQTGIRYGLILALTGIAFQVVTKITGGETGMESPGLSGMLGCLSFIATIAIIYMGLKSHRDQELGGYMSLGRGLTLSFWMGLISGLISSVWNYIFLNFISPETMDLAKQQLDIMRAQVEDGELPEWALSTTEWAQNLGTNPLATVIFSLIIIMFIGFIVSLFVKKDPPLA